MDFIAIKRGVGFVNTSSTPNVQMGYTDGTANRVRPTSLTYPNGRQVVFQYGPSKVGPVRPAGRRLMDDAELETCPCAGRNVLFHGRD